MTRAQRAGQRLHPRRRLVHQRRHDSSIRAAVRGSKAFRRHLYRTPHEDGAAIVPQGALYFRVPDLVLAVKELKDKGAVMFDEPHLTAPMPDHDLWMAFLKDPDGHLVGLMMEAPKGYQPPSG